MKQVKCERRKSLDRHMSALAEHRTKEANSVSEKAAMTESWTKVTCEMGKLRRELADLLEKHQ